MENCGIMTAIQKTDIHGNGYTEVHVMDFSSERIWRINFDNPDVEPIPETLREYIRKNGERIKAGRWFYRGTIKK